MEEIKKKFNAFDPALLSDWEVAAREELNGANPWEKLVSKGNGLSILPFYDRNTSRESLPPLPASKNIFLGARTWYNCPCLVADDPKKTNEKALECLREGADGIFFELNEEINFEVLLKDIEWQYCSLNFLAKKNQEAVAAALNHFITEKKIAPEHLCGALFGNDHPSSLVQGAFRFGGIQILASTSPADEIAAGFSSLISRWKKYPQMKTDQIAFSVSVGNDFFMEIAKLRAIRVVWKEFLAATKSATGAPLFIHAYSLPWTNKDYQPHGNMLKSTTAGMAAILGGCDALTINPEDPDQSMMARVARNVSNVLREESHFSKVADAVAGSYFIEDLTQQLATAAWKSVQTQLTS